MFHQCLWYLRGKVTQTIGRLWWLCLCVIVCMQTHNLHWCISSLSIMGVAQHLHQEHPQFHIGWRLWHFQVQCNLIGLIRSHYLYLAPKEVWNKNYKLNFTTINHCISLYIPVRKTYKTGSIWGHLFLVPKQREVGHRKGADTVWEHSVGQSNTYITLPYITYARTF